MRLMNSESRYGYVAIILHWIMAILIMGLLVLGIYMTSIPVSMQKLKLFGWHKEYGILVLWLVLFRIIWRIGNITPLLPPTLPEWQKLAAYVVHWSFYFFMFALPLTGWMMTSAAGLPVSFFGIFLLPDFVAPNAHMKILFEQIHQCLAYTLIAVIGAHVGAALKHHFFDKDDIMRRMIS